MVFTFFDKKIGSGTNPNVKDVLAQELHKPVIKKFKRRKVYARFNDNIWAADLPEVRSLSSFNCGYKYLLCVIDVFTKYTWVKPLKDEKEKQNFLRTLKSKIYKKMTAKNKKSYLGYLNKLADEYDNAYHNSTGKKPVDAHYSALNEEIEANPKSTKFKVGDRVCITKNKTFLVKVTLKIDRKKYLRLILC